jgi:hypothetical protein
MCVVGFMHSLDAIDVRVGRWKVAEDARAVEALPLERVVGKLVHDVPRNLLRQEELDSNVLKRKKKVKKKPNQLGTFGSIKLFVTRLNCTSKGTPSS